jgi:hypothetical protein
LVSRWDRLGQTTSLESDGCHIEFSEESSVRRDVALPARVGVLIMRVLELQTEIFLIK